MKKLLLIIFTLIAFSFNASFAQTNTYEQIRKNNANIEAQLNLTEEQQKQLQEISTRMYAELEPHIQNLSSHIQMITQLANGENVSEEQVATLKKEFDTNEAKLSHIKSKYDSQVNQILTPQQRAIYNKMRSDLKTQLNSELKKQQAAQRRQINNY